jgi:hypothetical protein
MTQMQGKGVRRKENSEHLNVGLFLGILNKYPVVSTGEEHVRPAAAVNIQRHAAVVNTTINAATPAQIFSPAIAVDPHAAASDAHLLKLSVHLILFSFIRKQISCHSSNSKTTHDPYSILNQQ